MALTGAERQARYRAKGKERAAVRRYQQTDKGKAAVQRYRRSAKWRAANRRANTKRLCIGGRYVGYCTDSKRAEAINAHIKARLSAFQRLQSRTETESRQASAVSPEAIT